MKETTKKTVKKSIQPAEFRPYRVLFLVVVVAVTCLVLFAVLGVAGTVRS